MESINWVKARSECSAMAMFERLKLEIGEDVNTRNEQRPKLAHYVFRIVTSENSITVLREGERSICKAVTLSLNGDEIVVKKAEKVIFSATVTLNDECECKFKICEAERESWQLRKIALEDLFFVGF